MENIILLNSNENTRQVEEEEKTRFVIYILETLGIPIEEIWDENGTLTVENKIKLRQLLAAYNIEIIQNIAGELKIYNREDGEVILIGEWKKPKYTLKRDYSQIDPSKKLFFGDASFL